MNEIHDPATFWDSTADRWVQDNRTEKYRRRLANVLTLIERHVAPCACLDIGCGDGALLSELSQRGFDVWGGDVSQELVQVSRDRLRDRMPDADRRIALIRDNRFPFDRTFGLITVLGVLVYIPNHRDYLAYLRNHLEPNGFVMASITQARSLHTLRNVLQQMRRPSIDPEWRRGIVNLLRTGAWSGGFMPYTDSGRTHSAVAFERLLFDSQFDIIERLYVYNMEPLDRAPLERSVLGRWLAKRWGWRQAVLARRRS